jgi:2',3'-cyclic-nucleotide 2'-phosphodiesterase (5'-nucleotidase family)
LVFTDEVAAVQREVEALESEGVNKIIAVGHAGIHVDKKMAAEVRGLDVIVGGHTNTFLYTGNGVIAGCQSNTFLYTSNKYTVMTS